MNVFLLNVLIPEFGLNTSCGIIQFVVQQIPAADALDAEINSHGLTKKRPLSG